MQIEVSDEAVELVDRVAAIDIAKASGMVCVRLPHPAVPGRRTQEVFAVAADSGAILELGERLTGYGVQQVVMEATGAYWRPFFYLLEAAGLSCVLVNARDVKNVPGRPKTDKLDAVWLAKLAERGMLRASFVPPKPVRQLRDLTRTARVLTQERTRHKQRVEKVLEDAQIKLSTVASDIFGVSGRAMLDALCAGQRDPQILAALARGRMLIKQPALVKALTGCFEEHHAFLIRTLLDTIDHLSGQIDALGERIEQLLAKIEPPAPSGPDQRPGTGPGGGGLLPLAARLDEIPGIGPSTARVILAEVGPDIRVFPTAGHLVSWAKLSPRTIQSGAKSTHGPTGKGNPWLRGALGEAAAAAARTDTFLGARYRRLVKRRGHMKALVAVARSILVIVWQLINDPAARYHDLGADHYQRHTDPERKTRDLVRQLHALGHQVTLAPAPA
ncbi:MAG TPA: IS110 family transposase [Solirubrobacteraceae bacterium]|nr:IS110 family transposase [Solirubrobacteraceae bacterium]